jgi:hypothetical protein
MSETDAQFIVQACLVAAGIIALTLAPEVIRWARRKMQR